MEKRKGNAASVKWLNTVYQQRYLLLMLLPGLVWILIFCYIPMAGVRIAFKEFRITKAISEVPWIGFAHFKDFFQDDNFANIMGNTLGMSLIKLLLGFPIPIIFAVFLNEIRNQRLKKFVQTTSYLPHFISWVVLGGILINWLSTSGFVNEFLTKLHLISEPVSFLGKAEYFWVIAWLSDSWKEFGWSAIIYLAAITSIDQSMYEAAEVDGASRLQKIWYITVPCIKSTIAILLVLQVASMLDSNFDQVFILNNPLNDARSKVIDLYVYRLGMEGGRYSYATAVGLFKSVIGTILLIISNVFSKRFLGRGIY